MADKKPVGKKDIGKDAGKEAGKAPVKCPECDGKLKFGIDVEKGEIISCPECAVELEVVKVDPSIKVELAPEEEEDWGE
ncbi:MAG: alpha-aminoadipate/glutamate carrier protein LysW [Candidatus Altiarchaeota archaeon]